MGAWPWAVAGLLALGTAGCKKKPEVVKEPPGYCFKEIGLDNTVGTIECISAGSFEDICEDPRSEDEDRCTSVKQACEVLRKEVERDDGVVRTTPCMQVARVACFFSPDHDDFGFVFCERNSKECEGTRGAFPEHKTKPCTTDVDVITEWYRVINKGEASPN